MKPPAPWGPCRGVLWRACALLMAGSLLLLASQAALAGPRQDRRAFRAYFFLRFPGIPLGAYAYGVPARLRPPSTAPSYAAAWARGKHLWERPFPNGRTYADCFPGHGIGSAAGYPRFDASTGTVQTLEMALNACRIRNGAAPYAHPGHGPLTDLDAYCKSLATGYPIHIALPPGKAVRAFARGEHFFWARRGQGNFSCAACHVQHAGQRLGGTVLDAALGQGAAFPRYQPARHRWLTVAGQYRRCLRRAGAAPLPADSRAFRDLLFYQMYMNNGLPLAAPAPPSP